MLDNNIINAFNDYFENIIPTVYRKNFIFEYPNSYCIKISPNHNIINNKFRYNSIILLLCDDYLRIEETRGDNSLSVEYSNPNLFNEILIFINKINWDSIQPARIFPMSTP